MRKVYADNSIDAKSKFKKDVEEEINKFDKTFPIFAKWIDEIPTVK